MKYFKKFNEMDMDYFHTDRHIHSTWTDGEGTIRDIARRAGQRGLREIAIVDHIREDSDYFFDFQKEVREVSETSGVRILAGFETRVLSFQGDTALPERVRESADIGVASVHRYPMDRGLCRPDEFAPKVSGEIELELSMAALKAGGFDVLGHPGGMSIKHHGDFPAAFFDEIIVECKKRGIAFELNSAYHLGVLQQLLPLLRKHNPPVSIGSDAHRVRDVGKWLDVPEAMEMLCK